MRLTVTVLGVAVWAGVGPAVPQSAAPPIPAAGSRLTSPADDIVIGEADCTADKVGTGIPAGAIGEPVSSVTLTAPAWVTPTGAAPAHCVVSGSMAAVDRSPTSRPINFRVALPAVWTQRAAQLGGSGMNGVVPNLTGANSPILRGFTTYGSDSGHQAAFGGRRGAPAEPATPAVNTSPDWTLNNEAIRNLGSAQMKKTRDAAMVVMERVYGRRPRFNYYIGTSQGGREALTVAQRYPADYDGIIANVPIVGFSTLMLAPELIRIREKLLANWVTPAKAEAIRHEFMRQCDTLDHLADGIINNYVACRAIFDVTQGTPNRRPWAARRCPDNSDPDPSDTSARGCLTDGQIGTLELVYSRYRFTTPLAHGATTFGMWVPNTDPAGSGLIATGRFRGQEGAADGAPLHAHLGVLGVTGFLMRNLDANPLDYVEGGPLDARRVELSALLDSADPDLTAFYKRGGKMIVTIGTNDTLASPGAQLDYYGSVVRRMGQATLDRFARLFVIPQAGHALTGTSFATDGEGRTVAPTPIPATFDRLGVLLDWVERNQEPPRSLTVTAGDRSLPLCSYPAYPRYVSGPTGAAASYECSTK